VGVACIMHLLKMCPKTRKCSVTTAKDDNEDTVHNADEDDDEDEEDDGCQRNFDAETM